MDERARFQKAAMDVLEKSGEFTPEQCKAIADAVAAAGMVMLEMLNEVIG